MVCDRGAPTEVEEEQLGGNLQLASIKIYAKNSISMDCQKWVFEIFATLGECLPVGSPSGSHLVA